MHKLRMYVDQGSNLGIKNTLCLKGFEKIYLSGLLLTLPTGKVTFELYFSLPKRLKYLVFWRKTSPLVFPFRHNFYLSRKGGTWVNSSPDGDAYSLAIMWHPRSTDQTKMIFTAKAQRIQRFSSFRYVPVEDLYNIYQRYYGEVRVSRQIITDCASVLLLERYVQ